MKPELRALTLVTLLAVLSPLAKGFVVPVIRLTEEPPPVAGPTVSFSLPKYQISTLERETVAACLILEAASQGEFGMRGVMAVIRNRSRGLPELFAPTVLRSMQFSALNKVTAGRESLWHAIQRAKRDRMWPVAVAVVNAALADDWRDPTHGATHYTRSAERTRWTQRLAKTVKIGAHSFYR